MSQNQILEDVEKDYLKKDVPSFKVGDTVKIYTQIVEGDNKRIQMFSGIVISKKGRGLSETFTVYRNAYGSSMQKVFVLHSPRTDKIEVVRSSKVRRAKLYYLKGKTGKGARLKESYVAGGNQSSNNNSAVEHVEKND